MLHNDGQRDQHGKGRHTPGRRGCRTSAGAREEAAAQTPAGDGMSLSVSSQRGLRSWPTRLCPQIGSTVPQLRRLPGLVRAAMTTSVLVVPVFRRYWLQHAWTQKRASDQPAGLADRVKAKVLALMYAVWARQADPGGRGARSAGWLASGHQCHAVLLPPPPPPPGARCGGSAVGQGAGRATRLVEQLLVQV